MALDLRSLSAALPTKSTATPAAFRYEFIDRESDVLLALEQLSKHKEIAFDAEGVRLSRSVAITVATFSGLDTAKDSPVFVVDVQALGGACVFSRTSPSFRAILEDPAVTKVTFDCRGDSDALRHQFDCTLSGALDLQIWDQALRIHRGEAPPGNCPYVRRRGAGPQLQGMESVRSRYKSARTKKGPAPHSARARVWVSAAAVAYAATDVQVLKELYYAMRAVGVPEYLMHGVRKHSRRYESVFRDRWQEVRRTVENAFVMPEHPIVSIDDLPLDHPLRPAAHAGQNVIRWNKMVAQLRSVHSAATSTLGVHRLCNDVLFVLRRDKLYTEEAFVVLRELADKYPHFTDSQRSLIRIQPGYAPFSYKAAAFPALAN